MLAIIFIFLNSLKYMTLIKAQIWNKFIDSLLLNN